MIRLLVTACLGVALFQQTRFQSRVDTVAVYPSVRDESGRLVTGLAREDFLIQVDNKSVEVTTFSVDAVPLNIVLLLDMSGSVTPQFLVIRESARRLVSNLGREDRMRIGTFGDGEVALSPLLTNDTRVLNRILSEELWPSGSTPLWRALEGAIHSIENEPDRRVIAVLSDGQDPAGHGRIRELAERTETMVYFIGLPGLGLPGHVENLAESTGGGHFSLRDDQPLQDAFDALIRELRSQYVVGFTAPALDGRTHALRVRARNDRLKVRAPSRLFLGERR